MPPRPPPTDARLADVAVDISLSAPELLGKGFRTYQRYRYTLPVAKKVDAPDPLPVRLHGRLSERGTRTPIGHATVIAADANGTQLADAESDATGHFEVRLPRG